MFCSHCGEKIIGVSNFCSICGSKILLHPVLVHEDAKYEIKTDDISAVLASRYIRFLNFVLDLFFVVILALIVGALLCIIFSSTPNDLELSIFTIVLANF